MLGKKLWFHKDPRPIPEIVDPFEIHKFKKYHFWAYVVFGMTFFHCMWNQFIFMEPQQSYCADESVEDPCSPECSEILYFDVVDEINFGKRFEWTCKRPEWELELIYMNLIAHISGLLLNVVFGVFKCRRRFAIIISCVALVAVHPLFFLPNELAVLTWMFMQRMLSLNIEIESMIFLMEMSPPSGYCFVPLLNIQCQTLGSFFYKMIFDICKNFYLVLALSCASSLVVVVLLVTKVFESHRYLFAEGKLEKCIYSLEQETLVNGEDPSQVRKLVEKAWRDSRCRPKSEETSLAFVKYPFVREVTLSVLYISFTTGMLNNEAGVDYSYKYSSAFGMASGSLYLIIDKYVGRVIFNRAGVLCAAIVYILNAVFSSKVIYYAAGISRILADLLMCNTVVLITELYPCSIFSTIIVAAYFSATISSMIFRYIQSMRVQWIASAICAVICLMNFGFFDHIPETKNTKTPLTFRDTELFLKNYKKKLL